MQKLTGILLFIKLCIVCVYGNSCPMEWSFRQVMRCLSNVTYGVNGSNILAGTETNTIHTFCVDGTLNQSVKCLEELYHDCGAVESLLHMAVPSMWRSAIDNLCNSLTEHKNQSGCIVQRRPVIRECLEHNDKMFQNSITKQENWNTLSIKFCGYFKGMRICTAEPVIRECDEDVGRTLGEFITEISPRLCQPGYQYIASDTSLAARISITCIVLVLTLLFSIRALMH